MMNISEALTVWFKALTMKKRTPGDAFPFVSRVTP
jgi:hypothetical protein